MNSSPDRLDPQTHARIFSEQVLPRSEFNDARPHEKPKAIILGGQPGAGKGRLADAAIHELSGDVVTIDPDQLRDYHPRIKEFQATNPYTWSGRTHTDASQWADELREATTAGRKNFIFDTTLSNGQWTADLIKDLQAKGYEVEVRAVAAHKLESEQGVDQRFAQRLDSEGFGRYVPAGARDAIYDKVPASLDTIHAQTDVPIRIFNREGTELYDSRTNPGLPGAALEDAREARLRDPKITKALNAGWEEQQAWHRDLPERLPQNPKVTPDIAQRILTERDDLKVVEGVQRDAARAHSIDHATRVRPNVAKGLGAIGAVATAYDAADTFHDATRLQGQGNATAAQARIERFATQNAGGWAGAVTFAGVGAAAGVESGPGLLVTGAIGGIVGAVAGDKVADWLNERKINRQDDRDGNTWTFDPKRPDQGWTREVPTKELDQEATIYAQGMPVYKTQTLKASPELTDELTYKASSTSIALALGSPPQNRNPYSLPANDQDMRSLQDAPWERNAQTGQWRREVVTSYLEHGLPVTQTETASPQRTVELERQSQEVVAKNAAQTPAAMAAAFQAAYEQNGWSRHGPLPEAVQDAKAHPGRIVGSDGDLYERGANGQWTHDGLLWDSMAGHNLKRELDATYQQQQRNLTIPTLAPVEVRPDPPSATPPAPTPAAAPSRSSPADRDHPDHAMLEQIRAGVRKIDEGIGKPYDEMSERISRSLLAACKDNRDAYPDAAGASLLGYGLNRVDHVVMGRNGNIFAVEGRLDSESHKRAHVSVEEAIRTPVEQSDAKVLAANQGLSQERDLARQQEMMRNQDDPSRSGPRLS